jgi:N-acetylmuramoyl-L-alanine amidase
MMKKIAIDIGHGSNTYKEKHSKGVPGLEEHDFNSAVGIYAKELAEHNGFEVYFPQPPHERDIDLTTRTNNAREEKVDMLISIHADANSNKDANGHWVFYWHSDDNSKRLAQLWDKHADTVMATNCRGVQQSKPNHWTNFHMCRIPVKYGIPSILIEHDFMTSPIGFKNLTSDDFRRKCAETLVRATCDYFGVPFNKPTVTKERIVNLMGKYFADTNGHWAESVLDQLHERDIFGGVKEDGKLLAKPNDNITRAETAALLNRAIDYVLQEVKK